MKSRRTFLKALGTLAMLVSLNTNKQAQAYTDQTDFLPPRIYYKQHQEESPSPFGQKRYRTICGATGALIQRREKQRLEGEFLQSIEECIAKNKERWIREEYEPFLRMDCTSAKAGEDLAKKTECASYLENLLLRKGFEPRVYTGKSTPKKEILHNPVETNLDHIRPVVYFEIITDPSLRTILFDTHYDRRPKNDNPDDPWQSNPFEPVRKKVKEQFGENIIEDERIYARGADDSVGHLMGIIWVLEAYKSLQGKLPVNVKVMFEGAEEIGSPGMEKFIETYKNELQADLVVIDDIWTNHPGVPMISTRLRGSLSGEICARTTKREGHSGSGSYLPNALGVLSRVMTRIEDPLTKEVFLDSYTKTIKQPSPEEIKFVDTLYSSWTEQERKEKYGAKVLVGDRRYSPPVRTVLLPSWDWETIPQGKNGSEGTIPSLACVAFKARLVQNQDPLQIFSELEQKLQKIPEAKYATIAAHITSAYPSFRTQFDETYAPIIIDMLKRVFSTDKFEEDWNGAGEPIASYFQSILNVPVFLTGYGHPNDNPHATNESMLVEHGLLLGVRGNALLMYNIGERK